MTTYSLPTGTWPSSGVDIDDAAVTVVDGTGATVLADFLGYRASGTTNRSDPRNYPLQVNDAASAGVIYQNITFRGNIPETLAWEDWYGQTGFAAFNGASFQLRSLSQSGKSINGTFNNCVWGVRDDLSSGGADWVHHKDGNATFNDPRVWIGRDDWLEIDDSNNRTMTINNGFYENQFVWLSLTWENTPSGIPNSFVYANNCLVHMRRWPYRPSLQLGNFLKANGGTDRAGAAARAPKLRFNNVCLVIPAFQAQDANRIKNALTTCQAVNGSRLLVLGGTHPDRDMITQFQNAGFSVLEDGSGTTATEEWNTRKANFLAETPTPPVVTSSLTSPCTFSVNVSATGLVTPVILSATRTNQQASATSMSASYPAHDSGDLILVFVTMDNNDAWLSPSVTAPGGETVTTEQALIGNEINSNIEQSSAIFSFQANATRAAGTMTVSFGGTDQAIVTVLRVQADTFKTTAPRLGSVTRTYEQLVSSTADTAAISAAQRQSIVFALANYSYHTATGLPSGWTERVNERMDFMTQVLITRDAETTNAEDVAAVPVATSTTSNGWICLTGLILPKGA